MYSTGLVLKNSNLLAGFTALNIWGEDTGFEIEAVCTDMDMLHTILQSKRFDLLIIENDLVKDDDYMQIKELRARQHCEHIALCSAGEDFNAARSGIRLGIDDYFTLPVDEESIVALFERIRERAQNIQNSIDELILKLKDLVYKKDEAIYDYLDYLYSLNVMATVICRAMEQIFNENDWLDLYINESVFDYDENDDIFLLKSRFTEFFNRYRILLPDHNETLDDVIRYIIYNPESDLRQKTISEDLRINKSYLSTIFISQTNERFVDYTTHVKLLRAAWLIKNTDMKIGEISLRMDYKDTAYFSKHFKALFRMTPSEYRLPDGYNFQI